MFKVFSNFSRKKVRPVTLKISVISKSTVAFFKFISKALLTLSCADPLRKYKLKIIHLVKKEDLQVFSLHRKYLPQPHWGGNTSGSPKFS